FGKAERRLALESLQKLLNKNNFNVDFTKMHDRIVPFCNKFIVLFNGVIWCWIRK
ncbi:MAG: hypothetical protein BROFUL_01926, partial [Candidatus Brocadia fulgida]